MFFLQEKSSQAIEESKLFSSKLKNMKLHLSELLSKKLRIELEIKSLTKSLIKKQKEYEKTLKLKINLEAAEILSPEQTLELKLKDFDLYQALSLYDQTEKEISIFLEENFPTEEHN